MLFAAPSHALWLVAALALAWAWDAAFGEPRDAWHPVAWLGRVLRPVGHWLRARSAATAFVGGAVTWCITVGLILAGAAWLQHLLFTPTPVWVAVPVLAALLKPAFAWRMLRDEVQAVEHALAQGVPAARERLARLVSRDVSQADAGAIRETAIETLAENLNDSVIAPLFWFALAGLPGALAYRAVNTMDAMWGYRGAWEWAGKWAARADDVLSWVPARLTALLLWPVLRSPIPLVQQAGRTPSPNGGWPMAALALRLGVRLSKPGVYALNGDAPAPGGEHVARALRWSAHAAWGGVGFVLLAGVARSMA